MPDVILKPVDFDPFAGASLQDRLRIPPEVQTGRDRERVSLLQGEADRFKGDERAVSDVRREIADTERGIAKRDGQSGPNVSRETSRGTQIAAELRSKGPKPVFPLKPEETAPPVTLRPVEGDPFVPPVAERGEFMKGVVGGLTGGNPKVAGAATRGAGVILDSDWLKAQGARLAAFGEENLKGMEPAVGSIANVRTDSVTGALSDFFTKYLPFQAGSALSSMAPTILSGLAGAGAGAAIGGPPGAIAGGLAGATLTGYPMNYGDIYGDASGDRGIQQAIREGRLTEVDVAKITAMAAVPITALDTWSLGRLGGALTAPVKKAIYQRIFQEMSRGGLREGTTEGLQQIISEVVQQGIGSDKTAKEAAIAVVDNAIGGMAGGGLTGGMAGAVQRAPAVAATPSPAAAPLAPDATAPVVASPDGIPEPQAGMASPIPAGRDVAAGFFLDKPPGIDIPAVDYTGGQVASEQGPDPGAPAQAVLERGAIPFEGATLPPMATIEQARVDAQTLQAGGQLYGADPVRIKNATMVAVYGENAAVRHAIESPELSAVGDAMLMVAPTVERVRGTIQGGQESRDITQDVVGAVDEIAAIRARGLSVADVMAQGVRHDLSYESQQLVSFLDANIDNPQALSGFLENYLQIVEDMGGVPSDVRGKAFDIVHERNFARRQADETAKREAFDKAEKAAAKTRAETTRAATEQHAAEQVLTDIVRAAVAGSGLTEAPTAMELAFAKPGKLKGRQRGAAAEKSGAETAGAIPGGAAGRVEGGTRETGRQPAPRAEELPGAAQARDAGNAQPVRAGSSEARAESQAAAPERPSENVARASQIVGEQQQRKRLQAITVKTRAIEAGTGRRVTVTENADTALREVNHQIKTMEALLECLA